MIRDPTSVDPVKDTLRTRGSVTSASPRDPPGPVTTWNVPGGRPAPSPSSASAMAVSGVCDAGLATTALPMASAGATFQHRISSGKFHGTMATLGPIGSRKVSSVPSALPGIVEPCTLSTAPA